MTADAKSLKRYFRETHGIPVRVNTSPTKARWVTVWISPDPTSMMTPPVYKHEFPLELRVALLDFIYPNSKGQPMNTSGVAGNIREHSIAMSTESWENFTPPEK